MGINRRNILKGLIGSVTALFAGKAVADSGKVDVNELRQQWHDIRASEIGWRGEAEFWRAAAKGAIEEAESVSHAFDVIKKEIGKNCEPGSYAHSWHCNISMMCQDAVSDAQDLDARKPMPHEKIHAIGNDAASRFMKLCFDAETKA